MRLLPLIAVLLLMATPTLQAAEKTKKKNKQTMTLYGQVYDSFTKGKVKAFVTLMDTDSTVVDTTTCRTSKYGSWSSFSFKIPKEIKKYIIKTTAEEYEDKHTDYEITKLGRKSWIIMPEILMKRTQRDIYKDVDLDGVVVTGTRVQVVYKGDTIVYNASAFNLPEGSMLDGLIRQLPGAELKDNGDIYINGKLIERLTLNGKDFFKGDNKVMLENLPYFTVKDLKVFYRDTEKNKMLGKQVEDKEYVMDVTLKREYARGYIANAEAGAGTEDRWLAKAFGMYYDDHTRVALFGNANNVNEVRTPGNEGNWDPKKVSDGVRKTRQVGMNIRTEDKDKTVDENLDVKFSWNDTDNEHRSFSETFADNGSIFSDSWSASKSDRYNLHIHNFLYLRKLKFGMNTDLDYTNNRTTGASNDSTYTTTLTNRNEYLSLSRGKSLNMYNYAYWVHSFESGDYLDLSFTVNYSKSKPNESFSNTMTYYAATNSTEMRNRFTDSHSMSYYYTPELTYSLQLPSEWSLRASYKYIQRYSNGRNKRYNLERLPESEYESLGWLPSSYEAMMTAYDDDNSHSYDKMERGHGPEIGLSKSNENMWFYLSFPYTFNKECMNYHGHNLDTIAHRSWREFDPNLYFRTKSKKMPIELRYYSYITTLSFEGLMPMTDTSNPLSKTISNPHLKNMFTHSANGRITFKNDSLASSVYIGFKTEIKQNAIGNRTSYNATTGAYTRMADNVDGNWLAYINSGWNRPLDKEKRFRMDLYGKAEYQRSVDFATATVTSESEDGSNIMNSPLSKVDNINLVASAKFTYKHGDFAAGINGKITSRHTRGNLDIVKPIDANDIQYGFNATYTIPTLLITVATDMTMYSRRGYESSMMNTDELVWNAQMTRSFFKGTLTAKLQAYDLLQNIHSRRYSVNSQGRTETWYNYIPRYVMFSLAYKFTRKPKK